MLTGELAFQAKDSLGVLRKIGQGKWKPVKTSLSAEAIDLISGMLEPNPLRRILMKDIISHPWFSKTGMYFTLRIYLGCATTYSHPHRRAFGGSDAEEASSS